MTEMAIIPASKALALNVQREMKARGWTQLKLAEACNLPQPRISEILSEKFDHRLSTVEKVADALGVTISAILMPPTEMPKTKKSISAA